MTVHLVTEAKYLLSVLTRAEHDAAWCDQQLREHPMLHTVLGLKRQLKAFDVHVAGLPRTCEHDQALAETTAVARDTLDRPNRSSEARTVRIGICQGSVENVEVPPGLAALGVRVIIEDYDTETLEEDDERLGLSRIEGKPCALSIWE